MNSCGRFSFLGVFHEEALTVTSERKFDWTLFLLAGVWFLTCGFTGSRIALNDPALFCPVRLARSTTLFTHAPAAGGLVGVQVGALPGKSTFR